MFCLLYMDYAIEVSQQPHDIRNYYLHFQRRNLSPQGVR